MSASDAAVALVQSRLKRKEEIDEKISRTVEQRLIAKRKHEEELHECAKQPRAKAKEKVSATTRWEAAIAKHIDAGLPRAKAVRKANRENPGLRAKMVGEANTAKPVEALSDVATREFQSKVRQVLAEQPRMNKPRAVSAVAKANPELHRAFIDEANQRGNR